MNKRKLGAKWELAAAKYLEQQGYFILEHNYYCPLGEIDLIISKDKIIAFVEVKYRSSNRYGYAAEAVDTKKQNKIRQTAMYYLTERVHSTDIQCRFDVISIDGESIDLIENAF